MLAAVVVASFLNINPAWSPDGRQLVFESRRHGARRIVRRERGRDGPAAAHSQPGRRHPSRAGRPTAARSSSIPIATAPGTSTSSGPTAPGSGASRFRVPAGRRTSRDIPRGRPDGRRIVFDSDRDGDEEVYVMDRDGARSPPVDAGRGARRACVVHARRPVHRVRVGAVGQRGHLADAGRRRRRRACSSRAPRGGGREGFAGRAASRLLRGRPAPDLFVAAADGTGAANITSSAAVEYEMAWSPDSRELAFYSDRTGRFEIYIAAADGSGLRQFTDTTYNDAFPMFSPDGGEIVFSSDRDGDWEIYAMRDDGSRVRRLTSSPGRDAHPAVSPDGRTIAFQSPRDSTGTGRGRPLPDGARRLETAAAAGGGRLRRRARVVSRRAAHRLPAGCAGRGGMELGPVFGGRRRRRCAATVLGIRATSRSRPGAPRIASSSFSPTAAGASSFIGCPPRAGPWSPSPPATPTTRARPFPRRREDRLCLGSRRHAGRVRDGPRRPRSPEADGRPPRA